MNYITINGFNGKETSYKTLKEALKNYSAKAYDCLTQEYNGEIYYYSNGKWFNENMKELKIEKLLNNI